MAGKHAHDFFIALDDTSRDQLFRASQCSSGGRFAANSGAIDNRLGGQNLLVGHFLNNAIALLDHPASARIAHRITNLDRRSYCLGTNPFTPGKLLLEAAIKWIGASRLNRSDAWHMMNQAKFV